MGFVEIEYLDSCSDSVLVGDVGRLFLTTGDGKSLFVVEGWNAGMYAKTRDCATVVCIVTQEKPQIRSTSFIQFTSGRTVCCLSLLPIGRLSVCPAPGPPLGSRGLRTRSRETVIHLRTQEDSKGVGQMN